MTTPTLSQLGEMTDEELNVRLAELAGISSLRYKFAYRIGKDRFTSGGYQTLENCESNRARLIAAHYLCTDIEEYHDRRASTPDYCSDANAVAEVRKGLSVPQAGKFIDTLYILLSPEPINGRPFSWLMMNADLRLQVIALITALTP